MCSPDLGQLPQAWLPTLTTVPIFCLSLFLEALSARPASSCQCVEDEGTAPLSTCDGPARSPAPPVAAPQPPWTTQGGCPPELQASCW